MLSPKFGFSLRSYRSALLSRMRVKYRRALYRIGGYINTVARNSLKRPSRKRNTSTPYGPPANHTGAIKNFLGFKVADDNTSVIVGPSLLTRPKNKFKPLTVDTSGRGATRLSILIFGGRQRSKRGNVKKFAPRPFMQIARQKALEAPRLKSVFREIGS